MNAYFIPFTAFNNDKYHLLMYFVNLYYKQYGPRSNCSLRSSQLAFSVFAFMTKAVWSAFEFTKNAMSRCHSLDKNDTSRMRVKKRERKYKYFNKMSILAIFWYTLLIKGLLNWSEPLQGHKIFKK